MLKKLLKNKKFQKKRTRSIRREMRGGQAQQGDHTGRALDHAEGERDGVDDDSGLVALRAAKAVAGRKNWGKNFFSSFRGLYYKFLIYKSYLLIIRIVC